MKKHKKILKKLKSEKKSLIQHCNMNNCYNEYTNGKLTVYNDMIEYISKL
jgi:hypothetical protein